MRRGAVGGALIPVGAELRNRDKNLGEDRPQDHLRHVPVYPPGLPVARQQSSREAAALVPLKLGQAWSPRQEGFPEEAGINGPATPDRAGRWWPSADPQGPGPAHTGVQRASEAGATRADPLHLIRHWPDRVPGTCSTRAVAALREKGPAEAEATSPNSSEHCLGNVQQRSSTSSRKGGGVCGLEGSEAQWALKRLRTAVISQARRARWLPLLGPHAAQCSPLGSIGCTTGVPSS